jgi:hypothetical protein
MNIPDVRCCLPKASFADGEGELGEDGAQHVCHHIDFLDADGRTTSQSGRPAVYARINVAATSVNLDAVAAYIRDKLGPAPPAGLTSI